MIRKRFLCVGLLLCTLIFMGCTPKDKEVVLSNDQNEETLLQEKSASESIELGNGYLNQGKYDNAKKAYEDAISKDASNKENYVLIKDKYIEKSRFDDAFYIIKLAIKNNVDIDNMKSILEEIKKNFKVITLEDTVNQNTTFTLPKKITLQVNDEKQDADVSWKTSNVDTSKAGSFTYEGTVEQYGRTVSEKLTVVEKKVVDNKPTTTSGELYKNDKLGFSINFPDSWKGRYNITESADGIKVYYKFSQSVVPEWPILLFEILKSSPELDDHLDTISTKVRHFKAKNITYVVGGATDMWDDKQNPEWNVFLQTYMERAKVVETLKY
ncbi:Ig-like domain-containing protein [Clostridium sp. SHJSY1]|uniref:Ig-like domain-containing protein n=1 Tax=Clostridium sp. SHJSY1 TaxID=2942483 RepID=UPI002874593B|nr:Ig-like domain-containing protein [Clostridium sp. SHJSY1]MDS0527407.1 Ig-like domain-containing protein [Clostridium sp. SHJSY1]